MAADLGQNFGAPVTVAGLGATIAAAASNDATEIDFGAVAPEAISLECILPMLTGTPDGNKRAVISLRWGASTGNTDDADNTTHKVIVSTLLASTTYTRTPRIAVLNRFLLINVLNDQVAGPSINSTYTLKYTPIHGDQA